MPPEIILTETYHDMPFLEKLVVLGDSPSIVPAHARTAATLLKRLKGKNFAYVTYTQKVYKIDNNEATASIGRYWPRNSEYVCYQTMLGSLRRVLSAVKSDEIDMENAQTQILSEKFPEERCLGEYCERREDILHDVASSVGVDRAAAKQLFAILVFRDNISAWKATFNVANHVSLPKFAYDFESAVQNCLDKFTAYPASLMYIQAARNKKLHTGRPWENSVFALWLQDLEAKCMVKAIHFIRSKVVEADSLIHDGLNKATKSLIDCKELGEYARNAT
jgi:hypothetical protein